MKKLILLTPLLLQACVSNGAYQDSEFDQAPEADQSSYDVMACYDLFDFDKEKIIVGLAVNYDIGNEDYDYAGVTLKSADIMHDALHAIEGLDRVWRFGCNDKACDYKIILKPNSKAYYYDFTEADTGESVSSSMVLECEYDADFEQWINKGFDPEPAPAQDDVEIKNTSGTKI